MDNIGRDEADDCMKCPPVMKDVCSLSMNALTLMF
jgi:hypothetical protein